MPYWIRLRRWRKQNTIPHFARARKKASYRSAAQIARAPSYHYSTSYHHPKSLLVSPNKLSFFLAHFLSLLQRALWGERGAPPSFKVYLREWEVNVRDMSLTEPGIASCIYYYSIKGSRWCLATCIILLDRNTERFYQLSYFSKSGILSDICTLKVYQRFDL